MRPEILPTHESTELGADPNEGRTADERSGIHLREVPPSPAPSVSAEEALQAAGYPRSYWRKLDVPRLVKATNDHYRVVKTDRLLMDDKLAWLITDRGICMTSFAGGDCSIVDERTLVDADTGEFLMSYTVPPGKGTLEG
jgi:hypothetical protein